MSIDLAKRAYLAAWKDAVTHPTRDMSPELAFEYWWQRELELLKPLPVPLLDKDTLQPLTPMQEFQSRGRGMRVVPPITVKDLQEAPIERVKDWSKPLVGDNDGPYGDQGIVDDNGRFAVNAEVTANFITGETTYREIIPGERVRSEGVIVAVENNCPPIPDLVDETWVYYSHPQLIVLLDGIPVPDHVKCKAVKRGEWADIYSKEHRGYARCNGNYVVAWAT